ncbi:unnamed protein product [Prunus armeniaca]
MLAYTLSKAPLGPAYIFTSFFTSFPSSDSAKAGGRKEEKTVTKKGSSHYVAAGKGDIELPNFLNSSKQTEAIFAKKGKSEKRRRKEEKA